TEHGVMSLEAAAPKSNVVVIGAGGIGISVVRALRARGHDVVLGTHHRAPSPERWKLEDAEEARAGAVWTHPIEVTDPDSCKAFFAAATKARGRYRAVV